MISLRLRFGLGGPFATPWLADTIAGHLCWAAARLHGVDMVQLLLDEALEGSPMFVVSDGFPGDLLPFPILPLPPLRTDLPADAQREAFRHGRQMRNMRRIGFVTPEVFESLRTDGAWLTEDEPIRPVTGRDVLKNQLSRATGTTGEAGQLFTFHESWINNATPEITVYALVRGEDEQLFNELAEEMARTGYGKRKAVGYGSIRNVTIERHDGFPFPDDANNGFLSLSTFVPAMDDPTDGQWEVLIKRGKLGEELAAGPNPFKRPLVMIRAGATFRTPSPREFYGRAVPDVAPGAPEVVQWTFAYPVPVRIREVEVDA